MSGTKTMSSTATTMAESEGLMRRIIREREEAMTRHKEPIWGVDPWGDSPTSSLGALSSNTQTAVVNIEEDYEKWYHEMKQELKDLRKANETIMKLLAEVLSK